MSNALQSKKPSQIVLACPRCQLKPNVESKFCASCGWELARPFLRYSLKPQHLAVLLVATVALWGLASTIQRSKAGKKPTIAYVAPEQPKNDYKFEDDQELAGLKQTADATPQDFTAHQQYSQALLAKVRSMSPAPAKLVFETMEALGKVLELAPNDPPSLVGMADIAFNQQVFDKAISYYERYLKIAPEDLAVKGRYASSLTFIGKTDEAIKMLEDILRAKPNDFHAEAYLAITYAQRGDNDKALALGEIALQHAPSNEARKRFSEFVLSLKSGEVRGNLKDTTSKAIISGVDGLVDSIKNNPIAGPKFVRFAQVSESELNLFFKDFPMQQMPQFAKDKFLGGIKSKALELRLPELKKINFLDQGSGEKLEQLNLK